MFLQQSPVKHRLVIEHHCCYQCKRNFKTRLKKHHLKVLRQYKKKEIDRELYLR